MKKKKVYIVFFIYNETSWGTYGSFATRKKAEAYIAKHHLYKTNSPMYIIEAHRYKKE